MFKNKKITLDFEWKLILKDYLASKDWQILSQFIEKEYLNNPKETFPAVQNVFKAFNVTPFSKVKVVILGQDPYHGAGQAHGLSFSVPENVVLPPSLKNIYKEIEGDLEIKKDFTNGNLENWAKQGVFLLNSILTVSANLPSSHKNKGWEKFTDFVIQTLSNKKENLVFMLFGNYAKSKKDLIDAQKHLILESAHPSPFSANKGFLGGKHFSKCNNYLKEKGIKEINW